MDECLEIVYQAGFLYKHKEIYGNEELEVLERAKDLKRMNYSLFENCELNKSFLFYKVCEVLEKKNNQMDLLTTGWLNTILGKKEKGIQKELEVDDWDDCYLSYEYTFLSIVEVYCMTHTRKQLDAFLEDVSIEMLYQLQGIELMIKEYQSHCKEIQYENLKNILVDLFSDGLHKVEMEYPEEVYEIIRNCLELKSFILPFYLLCFCYQKDFNKEWRAVKNLIDRNYLKEEIETDKMHLLTEKITSLSLLIGLNKFHIYDAPFTAMLEKAAQAFSFDYHKIYDFQDFKYQLLKVVQAYTPDIQSGLSDSDNIKRLLHNIKDIHLAELICVNFYYLLKDEKNIAVVWLLATMTNDSFLIAYLLYLMYKQQN